ncbi:hypothetical protein COP2_020020 [Malus domestica]
MTINDLVKVKQYEHKSTEDFIMRFTKTRMKCQFPINHAQLIYIAQKTLRLPLRKKFYDVQFSELQELVIAATKYEKLLAKKQQVKYSFNVPLFYKSKVAIHQVEFEGPELGENDSNVREGIEMCVANMTTHFKQLMLKAEIYKELVWARVIVPDSTKKMPKPEKLRGKKYCKLYYTFNHSITNCEEMSERRQAVRPSECARRLPDRPQAAVIKGVEQDARRSVMRAVEKETSKNVFQRRLNRDSEPKGLSKVFKNYEVSEEVEDKEAKMPKWVEVRPPKPSYHSNSRQRWIENIRNSIPLVTKKDLAQLGRKWYIVGKDGKLVREMRAFIIMTLLEDTPCQMPRQLLNFDIIVEDEVPELMLPEDAQAWMNEFVLPDKNTKQEQAQQHNHYTPSAIYLRGAV